MKTLLKYLFPVIAALAFLNGPDNSAPAAADDASVPASQAHMTSDSKISETESELCLPRQVSSACPQQLQSSARRTGGMHRNNIEFTKSGKIINADLRYFIQRQSIIIHCSLIEPALRLLYLGRLII